MELQFLGRGAAFNVQEGNTSAFIREGNRILLIDCGELVFSRLLEKGILTPGSQIDVCLTHLHCDHAGSLGTLILYCMFTLGQKLRLVLPQDDKYRSSVQTLLKIMGCTRELYTIVDPASLTQYQSFTSLKYVPTRHEVPEVYKADQQAFSLIFESRQGGVFYSGDTCTTDALKAFLQTHPLPETVYMDTTDADYAGNVHLNIKLLQEAVPAALRSRIRMMHVNRPSCIEAGIAIGFDVVKL